MLTALLAEEAENTGSNWFMWVILGVFVVILVVFFIFSSRKNKKQREEEQKIINAVKPGSKVKTIGLVCGIVVEVDNEENTFVLETGSEIYGKSYMKFDKSAIYQTDAVADKNDKSEGKKAEEDKEETSEVKAEAEAEVAPAEQSEQPAEQTEDKSETK